MNEYSKGRENVDTIGGDISIEWDKGKGTISVEEGGL
jgi:hypothetical protein